MGSCERESVIAQKRFETSWARIKTPLRRKEKREMKAGASRFAPVAQKFSTKFRFKESLPKECHVAQ